MYGTYASPGLQLRYLSYYTDGTWECSCLFFFFQAEDGIRDLTVTGVQTCALPILAARHSGKGGRRLAGIGHVFPIDHEKVRTGPSGSTVDGCSRCCGCQRHGQMRLLDRKSTRLNSSHSQISYAVFCLKKKSDTHEHRHSPPMPARPHPRRPSKIPTATAPNPLAPFLATSTSLSIAPDTAPYIAAPT